MSSVSQADSVRRVLILGSTGSIGVQALEVVAVLPGLRVVGLAAHASAAVLGQAQACRARAVALSSPEAAAGLRPEALAQGIELLAGEEGVLELIARAAEEARAAGEPLTVLNGIVGAAGLRATLAALERGATLALANKESMVAGGRLVHEAARCGGGTIVPVDSEHSALFQCVLAARPPAAGEPSSAVPTAGRLLDAEELILTGSGGPFRGWTRERLAGVTAEAALRHPTWSMGPKITVDSATLMNKGLEVIEAHELFGVPYADIRVLVQPQSLVHAMVRFADGALLAHLGLPDMRVPIAYALSYPHRAPLPPASPLDLAGRSLAFEEPDTGVFRCLALARAAGQTGGAAPAALNAANEIAVAAFLAGELSFLDIERVVEGALERFAGLPTGDVEAVLAADAEARRFSEERVKALTRAT